MYMNTIILHMPPVQITTPSPWYYIPDETADEVMDCTQTAAGFVYYVQVLYYTYIYMHVYIHMCTTCSRELNVCTHIIHACTCTYMYIQVHGLHVCMCIIMYSM